MALTERVYRVHLRSGVPGNPGRYVWDFHVARMCDESKDGICWNVVYEMPARVHQFEVELNLVYVENPANREKALKKIEKKIEDALAVGHPELFVNGA